MFSSKELTRALIDMIEDVDPRNGNIKDQRKMILLLPILSEHFISDDIEEED